MKQISCKKSCSSQTLVPIRHYKGLIKGFLTTIIPIRHLLGGQLFLWWRVVGPVNPLDSLSSQSQLWLPCASRKGNPGHTHVIHMRSVFHKPPAGGFNSIEAYDEQTSGCDPYLLSKRERTKHK